MLESRNRMATEATRSRTKPSPAIEDDDEGTPGRPPLEALPIAKAPQGRPDMATISKRMPPVTPAPAALAPYANGMTCLKCGKDSVGRVSRTDPRARCRYISCPFCGAQYRVDHNDAGQVTKIVPLWNR